MSIYLGERECSIQRRHQKVIEEAPSPFLTPADRKAMGEQAVALARAVNYKSAGTVEFIVDRDRNFYFLEMNTRLQVEHPVTELVTGLDLVEWMIRIAAGERLTIRQEDVAAKGWAIEARVYAEDPYRNFLPSIGRLTRYRPPAEVEHVRVDTGVYEGGEIGIHYDPMIAKLCAWGEDRPAALAQIKAALDEYVIRGLNHNIPFLAALVGHPRFAKGNLSTDFIADEFKGGFKGVAITEREGRLMAVIAAFAQFRHDHRAANIAGQLAGHEAKVRGDYAIRVGERRFACQVSESGGVDGPTVVKVEGTLVGVSSAWSPGRLLLRATICDGDERPVHFQPGSAGAQLVGGDDRLVAVQIERTSTGWRLDHGGHRAEVSVLSPRVDELMARMPVKPPPDTSRFLLSPMPGLLVSLAVDVGQDVKAGEVLAVVEAMKMENVLRAERDGVVGKLHAKPGDSLAVDQHILEFA